MGEYIDESKLPKLDDESEFFLNEKKYLLCMLFKFGYGNWELESSFI